MNSISNFVEYLKTCSDEDFSASLDDKFTRYVEGDILCLVTEYPEEIIKFLYLFKIYTPKQGTYVYPADGTKAVFVKTQMCWKLKKRNKVYCKIIMK